MTWTPYLLGNIDEIVHHLMVTQIIVTVQVGRKFYKRKGMSGRASNMSSFAREQRKQKGKFDK